ncbi:MAG: DUF2917 domain-containing protein [Polaromonas sp.]|uniref:DUF2917 domain-containing protein n=1 Tax=Polaromonas sp. TaxID=1869339 RepID=UPI002735574A|nr:DUF2917 domain-containing protein [Polaromonas sp.]MDP3796790.1 DUF2917 domain-containing protein [Polaromonas sp.]
MDHAIAHHSGDHYLPQATDAAAARAEGLPGCWKLGAGRVLTLHARQAGVLRIAHGRVWVTFNKAGDDLRVRAGDHFLSRGESLPLSAGEAVVMESFGVGHASSAYFNWEPAAAARPVPVKAAGWRAGVVQPLLDLRLALGLVGGAVGRLARGLAGGVAAAVEVALTGFAVGFLATRARGGLAERAFKAQSRDTRAHCSIN